MEKPWIMDWSLRSVALNGVALISVSVVNGLVAEEVVVVVHQ